MATRGPDDDPGAVDVVEGGDRSGPGTGLPRWVPRAAAGLAAVVAVLAVTRGGLLSSDGPPPGPRPDHSPSRAVAPRLVVRVGDRLLLADHGGTRLAARLPQDTQQRDGPALVAVTSPAGPTSLVGVAGGTLFRVDRFRPRWRSLGPAESVVGAADTPGLAYVVRDGQVVEVEVESGTTVNARAFPGYDPAAGVVVGLVANDDGSEPEVLQSRLTPDGRMALSLLWSPAHVRQGAPERQPAGIHDTVLGIARDWVLTLDDCPGTRCRVVILSVTRDGPLERPVAPPPGWTFVPGPSGGQTHEALVAVREVATGRLALARLVPGGDRALLVRDTVGIVVGADLADGPRGSVAMVTQAASGGRPRVRVWDPEVPNVAPLARPATVLPPGAKLVCICG